MANEAGLGGRTPRLRRLSFIVLSVLVSTCAALICAEMFLRVYPQALGFERLIFMSSPLKHALGKRYRMAYRRNMEAHLRAHGRNPALEKLVLDPEYGILLAPRGTPIGPSLERPFTTDALGFRNTRIPEHADILFVGDSFTAGVNVPDDTLFTNQVSTRLGQSGYQAAAAGWGPRQYTLAVKECAPRLRPRWVVIATYFENDVGDVWVYDAWKASPFETYTDFRMYGFSEYAVNTHSTIFDRWSVLFNLLRFHFGSRAAGSLAATLPIAPAGPGSAHWAELALADMPEIPQHDADSDLSLQLRSQHPGESLRIAIQGPTWNEPSVALRWRTEDTLASARVIMQTPWWSRYAAALADATDAAKQAGAETLLVLIPTQERVLAPFVAAAGLPCDWPLRAGRVPDGSARAVASLAADLGIDFLDLAPVFRKALPESGPMYMRGDIHFNSRGHDLTGQAIADALTRASGRSNGP